MLLQIRDLNVTVGKRILIERFTASWPQSSLVAILGSNGVGKTTLLNHIAGWQLKARDRVFLRDKDILRMCQRERARRISSISQYDHAPLETRVFDRIAHGLYPTEKRSDQRVLEIAQALGIEDLLERPLHALSGGQRKKVHIARALVNTDAEVFVLDEPDASLDAEQREKMLVTLKKTTGGGKLVIVSLHHKELAERYADFIVDLNSQSGPQFHQPAQQTHPSY